MDPGLWQIPTDPYEDVEPLAIEGPEEEEIDEGDDDGDEVDLREASKILDSLDLPNYDDVEMRLAEPEMTATKQIKLLQSTWSLQPFSTKVALSFLRKLLTHLSFPASQSLKYLSLSPSIVLFLQSSSVLLQE